MAKVGTHLYDPRTGQRMVFLQTAMSTQGELFQLESFSPPGTGDRAHVHPFQESRCRVLSGSLRFRIDGEERTVCPGETVVIPANVPHHFWNDGTEEAHAIQEFRPALHIEDFFETCFALARRGAFGEKGRPDLLQLAVIMHAFSREVGAARLPYPIQRLLAAALAPVGAFFGYKSRHAYPRCAAVGLLQAM